MNNILDKFAWAWTHLAWLVAALIVMVDPRHVEEWAKQHEVWGGLIVALWAILLAWANKQKGTQSGSGTLTPPTQRKTQ